MQMPPFLLSGTCLFCHFAFVTGAARGAQPCCALAWERPEPTYLITKPFSRDTVRATLGQALFFHRSMATA